MCYLQAFSSIRASRLAQVGNPGELMAFLSFFSHTRSLLVLPSEGS
jgi:hypothetical protein